MDLGDRKELGRDGKEPSLSPFSVHSLHWSALSDKGRVSCVWQEQFMADSDSMRIFPDNRVLVFDYY